MGVECRSSAILRVNCTNLKDKRLRCLLVSHKRAPGEWDINQVYIEAHTLIPARFFQHFISRITSILLLDFYYFFFSSFHVHFAMQKEILHDKNIQITFTNYKFSSKQKRKNCNFRIIY